MFVRPEICQSGQQPPEECGRATRYGPKGSDRTTREMTNTPQGGPRAGRIRTLVMVAVLSFFLQGAFLASALQRNDAVAWATWIGVLCVACIAIAVALKKATALSRRGRARDDEGDGSET